MFWARFVMQKAIEHYKSKVAGRRSQIETLDLRPVTFQLAITPRSFPFSLFPYTFTDTLSLYLVFGLYAFFGASNV